VGHDIGDKTSLLPYNTEQNPSPLEETGQEFERNRQSLVNDIMRVFMAVLPSNYVSTVNGPWYTLQFQAIAEQLAAIQLAAQEIEKDSDFDFTRPDFLWTVLGTLVFPNASSRGGVPTIDGDTHYRAFLHQMVLLLLQGSKASVMEAGVELLTDGDVTLIEKFLHSVQRDPTGAWTIDNQFEVEINVEVAGGTEFPEDPVTFLENLHIVLEALKPAHVIYETRFLFRDVFGSGTSGSVGDGDGEEGSEVVGPDMPITDDFGKTFDDSTGFGTAPDESGVFWTLDSYYYDDLRKNCHGAQTIVSTGGETLTDRFLFTDVTVSFENIRERAVLDITAGVNTGRYNVVEVRYFIYGDDSTARAYTTSPTGLTGTATVEGSVITDTSQDFAAAVEGEVLTFTEGLNAGSYRLDTLLGPGGGPLGQAPPGPATQVRVSPCILRLDRRMPSVATGQSYAVTVDRLGVQVPKVITGEDVSEQFYE